jgi:Fe-S-cluster-containing dehydrogenase component
MLGGYCIVKYRVVIDKNRCVGCGISTGRCPVHARLLARVLETNVQKTCGERQIMGVFAENIYNYVKQLVESCPEKALIIERIEKE